MIRAEQLAQPQPSARETKISFVSASVRETIATIWRGMVAHLPDWSQDSKLAQTERQSPLFSLSRIVYQQIPLFAQRYEHLSFPDKRRAIAKDLYQLLREEYSSFVREDQQQPFTGYVMQAEMQPDQPEIRVNSAAYADSGEVAQAKRALELAKKEQNRERIERYALELEQVQFLHDQLRILLHELHSSPHALLQYLTESAEFSESPEPTPPEHWERVPQPYPQPLQAWLLQQNLDIATPLWQAPQSYAFVMPQSPMYGDKTAYWNTRTTLWIPALPANNCTQVFVQQFFHEFGNQDHHDFLEFVQDTADLGSAQLLRPTPNEGKKLPPRTLEQQIMRRIVQIKPELAMLSLPQLMAEFFRVHRNNDELLRVLTQQQKAESQTSLRHKSIDRAASTIAEIMLREIERGIDTSTPTLLDFAHEVVANQLVQGEVLDPQGLLDGYMSMKKRIELPDSVTTTQSLRDTGLQAAALRMPSVLNQVVSVADCGFGSFGGLSRANSVLNNVGLQSNLGLPSFGSSQDLLSHASSSAFTPDQLAGFIGHERALLWKPGTCVGCGAHSLVGECSLCYACELRSEGFGGTSLPNMTSTPRTTWDSATGVNQQNVESQSPTILVTIASMALGTPLEKLWLSSSTTKPSYT